MATIHGLAGEWARVKGTVFGLWPLMLGIFLAGFSAAYVLVRPQWGALMLALSLIGCFAFFVRGLRHIERYFVGARGEERVAAILKTLPDAYHVFNDFAVGRLRVDHVVAGPAGVFAVETKNWRGRVTVEDGHLLVDGRLPSRSPLAQVHREAAAVKTALADLGWKGSVTPVVAFASDALSTGPFELGGVVIMNSRDLRRSFADSRVVLAGNELERLIGLMEVPRT